MARKYIDYHAQRFGYRKPNTEFVQGYIEDLEDAGLKEGFYDIIMWDKFLIFNVLFIFEHLIIVDGNVIPFAKCFSSLLSANSRSDAELISNILLQL